MKTLKTSIVTLLAAILLFSCKKQELEQPLLPAAQTPAAVATTASDQAIQWSTFAEWKEQKQEHFTVTYTTVEDAGLTASIVDRGLVLVYIKEEATGAVLQLPYVQKDARQNNYWYYQVAEGQLLISCDVYGSADATLQNSAFHYLSISEDTLNKLAGNGYTKEALMNLSYSEVNRAIENL